MTQQPNQFAQSVIKGSVDLKIGPGPVSCEVDASEAGTLLPGQFVKLVDSAGGVPKVIAATADTDAIFGVVSFSFKDKGFKAYQAVEILAMRNGCIYLEASAAIARGADVMPVIAGQKVATAASGKRIIGHAFDKALASGDLIRVIIDLPGTLAP